MSVFEYARRERMRVHILSANGEPMFNRLYDDGTLVLNFESGFGFVDRLDIERFGWKIIPGWTQGDNEEPFILASSVNAA